MFGWSRRRRIRLTSIAPSMVCPHCGARSALDPLAAAGWRARPGDLGICYACVRPFVLDASCAPSAIPIGDQFAMLLDGRWAAIETTQAAIRRVKGSREGKA